jgi:cleavage and polyadenylation specificity factor subunit 1
MCFKKEGAHYNIYSPVLRVDPNMKCAVMLIYGFKLVVIPFHEEHIVHSNQDQTNVNNDQENNQINSLLTNKKSNENDQQANNRNTTAINSSLSSYTVDLRKLDNWLEQRIIDIEFLYGYYEPTLFILCESNMTWVGRYSVKKDTCNSVALSLNLTQKLHPIIWPVDKLPSDCLKCHAVPQPIGGVLIFAVNSMIYINQSVPSYSISLNSIAKQNSKYPFRDMEHVRISLDSSQATFIDSNRMVISLKGGEIYTITLKTDPESLRTVQDIHFEKCPTSVISTTLTKCNDNFLFIGSRLGNSVLLKYTVQHINNPDEEIVDEESAEKEEPAEAAGQNIQIEEKTKSDFDELDYLLELKQEKKVAQIFVKHTFEICDVLLNIGPCGSSIVGESTGDYSEYTNNSQSNFVNFKIILTLNFCCE